MRGARHWTCVGPSPGRTYWYKDTNWRVEHCGHPTANYPYLIYDPDGNGILAPNGRGWTNVKDAREAVERFVAGMPVEWMYWSEQRKLAAQQQEDDRRQRQERKQERKQSGPQSRLFK
jgi:hypothetical protein